MLFSRARNAAAGIVVTSVLAFGVAAPVQAAPVTTGEATSATAARKAPAVKKLAKVKKKATKVAVKKQRKFKKLRVYLANNKASIPAQIHTTAVKQTKAGSKRVAKLTLKVSGAKSVKRVKKLRGKINEQRPGDIKTIVVVAKRAAAAAQAGDAGLLEDLLEELAGLDVDKTVLAPVVDLVDGLLDAVLGIGGGGDDAGNPLGILDELLDLLDGLLGGLLGGLL